MARIKFNLAADEFNGSIQGQTFYAGNKVSTIKNIAQMRRRITSAQRLMSNYLIWADRNWRLLSDINRGLWNLFAITYPQFQNRDHTQFLTGYELFTKRNQHFNIFTAPAPDIMESPNFVEYSEDIPEINIYLDSGVLTLQTTYPRGNSDLACFISISGRYSHGRTFIGSSHRLMNMAPNISQTVDITQDYVDIYGQLPKLTDVLAVTQFQCGIDNGQYFFPPDQLLIVSEPPPPFVTVKFGRLYNFTALQSQLSSSDTWRVPTGPQIISLFNFVNASGTHSRKDISATYWTAPNTGADDFYNFSARGAGRRNSTGAFADFKIRSLIGSRSSVFENLVDNNTSRIGGVNAMSITAFSCRFVNITTALPNGSFGTYTGNDGKMYHTVVINGWEWTIENLIETQLRDHSTIPLITDNALWLAATTPAFCYPNGNSANE